MDQNRGYLFVKPNFQIGTWLEHVSLLISTTSSIVFQATNEIKSWASFDFVVH